VTASPPGARSIRTRRRPRLRTIRFSPLGPSGFDSPPRHAQFVLCFLALLLSPVPAVAASVPPGWRLPSAADRTREWQDAGAPFHIRGDFNGDGIADEAWILFRKHSSAWAVFAFLGTAAGPPRSIKLAEEHAAPAQRFVLETIRPSGMVFRTACGKGYVQCASGEPLTIQFPLPSISLCQRESSCSVYVWQLKEARFQRIRMSD
jgi:hypothetical protein